MKTLQKIKAFISRLFSKKKKKDFLEIRVFELHARVFSLEKKLAISEQNIAELSSLVNKMSKVQYDLATSYNSMVGEIYESFDFEKGDTQLTTGMVLFGMPTDDDDDLIN